MFLSKQKSINRGKEDLLFDNTVLALSEEYIDALYSNEMFYSTECWNTDAVVDRELKTSNSKSSKLLSLKENTRMRVIGFGWLDLGTHLSKNGKNFTTEDLTLHFKMILSKQWSHSIPTKPILFLLAQKELPQLVMQAPDVVTVGAARLETSD